MEASPRPPRAPDASRAPSPADAGSPRTAPAPPRVPRGPASAANARYAYLVGRLRNRQITMEEATELFEIQMQSLSLLEQALSASPPIAKVPSSPGSPPGPSAPSPPSKVPTDDLLVLSLLMAAIGAGLFAALVERSRRGPPGAPPGKT